MSALQFCEVNSQDAVVPFAAFGMQETHHTPIEQKYSWNEFLLEPFAKNVTDPEWILHVIHGCVSQNRLSCLVLSIPFFTSALMKAFHWSLLFIRISLYVHVCEYIYVCVCMDALKCLGGLDFLFGQASMYLAGECRLS